MFSKYSLTLDLAGLFPLNIHLTRFYNTSARIRTRITKRRNEEVRDITIVAESPEFQKMFELLYSMFEGGAFVNSDTNISELSTVHQGLYRMANAFLKRHQSAEGKSVEALQSACVALSCTLDMTSNVSFLKEDSIRSKKDSSPRIHDRDCWQHQLANSEFKAAGKSTASRRRQSCSATST
ncbi:hypothetical protein BGZ94_004494, partial [Podila epigama]